MSWFLAGMPLHKNLWICPEGARQQNTQWCFHAETAAAYTRFHSLSMIMMIMMMMMMMMIPP